MANPTVTNVQKSPNGQNTITTYSNGTTSFSGPTSSGGQGAGVQVATNPSTGMAITPPVVQATSVTTPQSMVVVPPAPATPQNYNGLTNSLMTGMGYTQDTKTGGWVTPQGQTVDAGTQLLASRLDAMVKPVNTADIYAQASQDAGIQQKQQRVSELTGQLSAITAKSNADQLQLRQTGSTNGVTEAVYGGQVATISREAAIQSLPVAAQLSAAQGDLQMAQQHLDTLFQIKVADAKAQNDYQNNLVNAVFDFADKQQQRQLDAAKTQANQDFQIKQDNIAYARTIASKALSMGQTSLFSRITALNPDSPTYMTDIGKLGSQISAPSSGISAPTIKSINGTDMQWNSATGKWENPSVPAGSTNSAIDTPQAKAQGNINQINDILSGPIATVVGTNLWARSNQTNTVGGIIGNIVKGVTTLGIGLIPDVVAGLNGSRTNTIAKVEQLRTQLSLDALINAKKQGATFGALSDAEMKILANSATKLSSWAIKDYGGNVTGYNTTEKAFRQELDKINNYAKLDYIVKGGSPADIGVTLQPNGAYTTINSDGSVQVLN